MSFLSPSRRAAAAARIAGLATVSSLVLLAACAPDLGRMPQMKAASDYGTQRALPAPTGAAWPAQDWWKAYNDPQLDALIDEALQGSPDLRVAEARVRQARGYLEQSRGALLPSVSANGNINETAVKLNVEGIPDSVKSALPSDWQPFTQLGAKIDYQIDFFGKVHAAVAAASSQARAAEFELQSARLQISTAVAAAYADLVRLTADREAALEAVRVRGESLQLVSDRVRNGLENQGQVAQSSAEQNVSLGDVAAIDARIEQSRHQLAALVGKGPDRGLDITPNTSAVSAPWTLPSNLPADLIGRRPDIAAARLRVEVAADKIKVARADFYPNVSLAGSLLDLSFKPSDIFSKNVLLTQVGPAVSLPIFQGGRLKGAYHRAGAEYEEAVATYDKTVTDALKDVADAVSMQRALGNQLQYAQKAAADSQRAYDLATLRYKGGLSPYLVVLTAQSTLIQQRRVATDLQAQSLAANVALVRALGGGFIDNTKTTSNEKAVHNG
jgi:NodT family efflux transporter outer membrane factor (OMF) lipoprotein